MRIRTILILGIVSIISGALHAEGELLLKSGFEPSVQITKDMSDIVGADQEVDRGWEATRAWIASSRFVYLVGRDKKLTDHMASFITQTTGPSGSPTHVLCMENKSDDPKHKSTSRNEYSFFGRKPPRDYRQGYVRYWMKLQADLPDRIPQDKSTPWYMIMEWKEPNSGIKRSDQACRAAGEGPAGSNNYRINVGIRRAAGAKSFRWIIIGQHPQPCRKTEWSYTNPKVDVPFGRWFLVEGYMKKHAVQGRVYFAVNGEVVLDTNQIRPLGFTGRTQHADNPLELRFWSPLKNYHSMDWNRRGPVSQWYDDFELWTDFHPDIPLRDHDSIPFHNSPCAWNFDASLAQE